MRNASPEPDFSPRPNLHRPPSGPCGAGARPSFKHTEGSPIRRIGYQRWRRNLAVALGNGPASSEVLAALQQALPEAAPMVAGAYRVGAGDPGQASAGRE